MMECVVCNNGAKKHYTDDPQEKDTGNKNMWGSIYLTQ